MGGRLYVCGGIDSQPCGTAERFDADRGVWELLPPMGEARSGHAVAAMGGHLYVFGGKDGQHEGNLNSEARFNPERGLWESLPPLTQEARYISAIAITHKRAGA